MPQVDGLPTAGIALSPTDAITPDTSAKSHLRGGEACTTRECRWHFTSLTPPENNWLQANLYQQGIFIGTD